VTTAAAHTGTQSWRVSNSTVNGNYNGNFAGWPFSPGITPAAGQPSSSATADSFAATLWFKAVSTTATGDGSSMEFDFGNVPGTDRTNFFAIRNSADANGGLLLRAAESVNTPDQFLPTQTIATNLSRTDWHRLDFTGTFPDGAGNDTFTVALDGTPLNNPLSTSPNFNTPNFYTFEGYRDFNNFAYEQTNRLFWRSGATASSLNQGFADTDPQGFFVDDVTYRTFNSSNPGVTLASFDSSSFEPVPEPSSIVLAGLGVVGLLAVHRRRGNRRS
jgi:hypothetical protein